MATLMYSGPVNYAVFAVPRSAKLTDALRALLELTASGSLELLDLEILETTATGETVRRHASVLEAAEGFDPAVFDGAESGILDDQDLAFIGAELEANSRAIVMVYEDRSLAQVAANMVDAGGSLLWSGGIDITELAENVGTSEQDQA